MKDEEERSLSLASNNGIFWEAARDCTLYCSSKNEQLEEVAR